MFSHWVLQSLLLALMAAIFVSLRLSCAKKRVPFGHLGSVAEDKKVKEIILVAEWKRIQQSTAVLTSFSLTR